MGTSVFCLDGDVCFVCQHCQNTELLPCHAFSFNETQFGCAFVQCPSCGNLVGFQYALAADDASWPGFLATVSRISPVLMTPLHAVSVVRDPLYVSRIGGLSALEYHRTLAHLHELKRDASQLAALDRRMFEQVVAEIFRRMGYQVEVTKTTRDGGIDIVGIGRIGEVEHKLFVECKRKDPGNPVGVDIVRSLYGVHQGRSGANKSVIVSTTGFTKDAEGFATQETRSSWELDLYDFADLRSWLGRY